MESKVIRQVWIDSHLNEMIKLLARDMNLTEDEVINRALKAHLWQFCVPHEVEAWQKIQVFINRLIELGPVPGGRTWKREDLYER
jgi:hypothetical protein